MPKITAETRGYLLTALIVIGLSALGLGVVWLKARPVQDPAFRPEWRCTHPEEGEVCERVRPPSPPNPPRKP